MFPTITSKEVLEEDVYLPSVHQQFGKAAAKHGGT